MSDKPKISEIITTGRQNIIIYNSSDGKASVALYAKDGTVWMNQKQNRPCHECEKHFTL